jgi:hypothetical protein
MYLPNPTAALRSLLQGDSQDNPSKKQWLIGGGITLGVGLIGFLAWRHFRGGAQQITSGQCPENYEWVPPNPAIRGDVGRCMPMISQ